MEIGAGVTESAGRVSGPGKTEFLPLGARMACLLLLFGASLAVGLLEVVCLAFQSAGK